MRNQLELLRSFIAKNKDGDCYQINIFGEIRDSSTMNNPFGNTLGNMELRLEDGTAVNIVGKNRYTIYDSGIELTSDDPDAP